jgi:hypothetical protein
MFAGRTQIGCESIYIQYFVLHIINHFQQCHTTDFLLKRYAQPVPQPIWGLPVKMWLVWPFKGIRIKKLNCFGSFVNDLAISTRPQSGSSGNAVLFCKQRGKIRQVTKLGNFLKDNNSIFCSKSCQQQRKKLWILVSWKRTMSLKSSQLKVKNIFKILGYVAGPVIQATGMVGWNLRMVWSRVTLCRATHIT